MIRVEGPKIHPMERVSALNVSLARVGVKKKEDAGARAVQALGTQVVEFINRPHQEIALESIVGGVAVKRKNAQFFLGSVRGDVKRPDEVALLVALLAVVNYIISERPAVAGHVARRGVRRIIERNDRQVGLDVGRFEAIATFKEKWKAGEKFVVAANRLGVAHGIGFVGESLVFGADDGPKLPAGQMIAVAQVEQGINIIVGNDVLFDGVRVNREHHKMNLVVKEAVAQVAVKGDESRIIKVRVNGLFLKIDRKNREAAGFGLGLVLPLLEAEKLQDLQSTFCSESAVGNEGVKKVDFVPIHICGSCMDEEGWKRPLALRADFLGVK